MPALQQLQQLALARDVRTRRAAAEQAQARHAMRLAQEKVQQAQSALAHTQVELLRARQGLQQCVNQERSGWRVVQTLQGIGSSRLACAGASHVVTTCTAALQIRQVEYEDARHTTLQAMRRTQSVSTSCERLQKAAILDAEVRMEDLEEQP